MRKQRISKVIMITSFRAEAEPSDIAVPSKQRRRTSNRIKFSRELMIKLTAALSNGGGGGGGSGGGGGGCGLIRDAQVAGNINGKNLVTSLISHKTNEYQHTNDSFFIRGRGLGINCDNSSQQVTSDQISSSNYSYCIHLESSMNDACSSSLADYNDTSHQATFMHMQENLPLQTCKSTAAAGENENENGNQDDDDNNCFYNDSAANTSTSDIDSTSDKENCATSYGDNFSDAGEFNISCLLV